MVVAERLYFLMKLLEWLKSGPAVAKGDQRGPRGTKRGLRRTKGPVGSRVQVGGGSYHQGYWLGTVCLLWCVFFGVKAGAFCAPVSTLLLPCVCCTA